PPARRPSRGRSEVPLSPRLVEASRRVDILAVVSMPVTVVVSSFKAPIEPLPFQRAWRKFDTVPSAGAAPNDALRLAIANWPSVERNTHAARPPTVLNMNTRALLAPLSIMSKPPEVALGTNLGNGPVPTK